MTKRTALDTKRTRLSRGAVSGVLAVATGLAAGELVSGLNRSLTSPVLGVGNRVVDLVPVPVKDFAISTFGTHDKQALLIGLAVTIAVLAVVFGMIAARRILIGLGGIGLFGVVGAVAAVTGRTGTTSDAIPSVVAAVIAMGLLVLLLGRRQSSTTDNIAVDPARRRFLVLSGGVAVAAVVMGSVGRALQSSAGAVARRALLKLPSAKRPLAAIPVAAGVPALATVTPFITPNKDFYRIDTALVVPRVDVDSWKLRITGMVDHERTYTYDDLLARDLVERDITLTCVSNEVGGQLMGTARWLGVPLSELLEEAGVKSGATQVVGRSVDGWTSGFPTAVLAAASRDAIVAVGMNGEPLPFAHGFPARLVVPGLYGYVSATKWLERIELKTLEEFDAYWVPRGYSKQAPIKLASRIDVPRGLATVPAGKTAIAGIAWAQTTGVAKVELKIDDGPWQEATLASEHSIDTWRQWTFEWDAPVGRHDIIVRATDRKGRLQTEKRHAPLPNGATGWHQILVFVK